MKTAVPFVSVLLFLAACSSSCERKPERPNAELCTWLSEANIFECEDGFDHTRPEADLGNLMCTTLDGYLTMERYLDEKEAKVRQLERELSQCRKDLN